MQNDDTWTQDGTEMVVIGTYWKRSKRDEDAAYAQGRFAGTLVLSEDPNPVYEDMEEFKTNFYISVPKVEHAAGCTALYGVL